MKKLQFSLLIALVGLAFLVTGCTDKSQQQLNSDPQPTETSPAKAILITVANSIGKTEKDIKSAPVMSWNEKTLQGYIVKNNTVKSTNEIRDKLSQIFDGWVEKGVGDGIWQSYMDYLNDNLICSVHGKINYDLDELMNLAFSEEEDEAKMDEANKKLDKIFEDTDRTFEVSCAEFDDKYPSPLDFSFDMAGEEPFWNADLRVDMINYTLPNNETHDFKHDNTYINHFEKKGENLIFTGEKYDLWKIKWELTKTKCIDGGKGDTHEYKVKISFGNQTYEGCADKADNFLVGWRNGTLENLLKQINYEDYKWSMNPKTSHYDGIQTDGNLVEVSLTEPGDEKTEYLVLGKTENGWETYWQGTGPVDYDTCEKYVEVPNLMDFWIFSECPRG